MFENPEILKIWGWRVISELNRKDTNRLDEYRNSHPKKRFLTAKEVAKFIYDIHINASDYLCNANISLDDGKFTRMRT